MKQLYGCNYLEAIFLGGNCPWGVIVWWAIDQEKGSIILAENCSGVIAQTYAQK